VEVDFYLQEIARGLGVSMEALYTEYKKIRVTVARKKREEESGEKKKSGFSSAQDQSADSAIVSSNSPTISDLMAGYIYRYDFLDLFFREFRYTISDLDHIAGAALLGRLTSQNLDSDDSEALRILDLRLEEQHQSANPELIQRAFRDLLRILHLELLKVEKEKLLLSVDPNSAEYLRIYSDIVMKEKTFLSKN
jgi:hypothetical protein